tara:strand:- start:2860 stop:3288 length:429 start_codon:yes stop_codon:yes gene_type:complete
MPKPVLSDSLFNASDVATAVLDNADLSVTNQDFGVVDRSDKFTHSSSYSFNFFQAYSFNGFMFISFQCVTTSSPTSGDAVSNINDSTFYPIAETVLPGIGYEGDSLNYLKIIASTGALEIYSPLPQGIVNFYITINGFYRFT